MAELTENPWAHLEEKLEGSIPTATLQIYQYIADELARKQDTNVNRASSATMCVKRRWYQHHGHVGTPLTPRKMVNFMLGDLTEKVVLHFIKEALVGHGKMYSKVELGNVVGTFKLQGKDINVYDQKTLGFKLPDGTPISGHADGFGCRNVDGVWELIEIKSAADYGYEEFVEHGPGDYLKQSHALMLTDECKNLNVKGVRFFYLKKNTGHLYDKYFPFDEETAEIVVEEFMIAKSDGEPQAPHKLVQETYYKKPTGRTVAQFPCSYCSYLRQCKGPYDKEYKNGSPKFIFKGEVK